MSKIRIERVLALPDPLVGSTIYIVKAADATHAEMFFTNNDGSEIRHLLNKAEVNDMITTAINSFNNIMVVQDIATRNALVLERNALVLVVNATGDGTVSSGAAMYVYDHGNSSYYKVSEYESMDMTFDLSWGNITGGPSSSPVAIDSAVAAAHVHANADVLGQLGEGPGGNLTYKGNPLEAFVAVKDW